MSIPKKWVLVFLSNEPYIERAFDSIQLARKDGEWVDDIVLLVSCGLYKNDEIQAKARDLKIILREVPDRNFDEILNLWKTHKIPSETQYVLQRGFMYNKFCAFDVYFRQWDIVFYLDAGAKIQGPLERMKKACEPDNCIYAHSDSYPAYQWKFMGQFRLQLFDNQDNKREFLETYLPYLEKDYFQGTMFIYDTKILEDTTVEQLFALNEKYPVAVRMDQGILNLHFTCQRKLWKQIPLKDDAGFLYDFLERPGYTRKDYLILKYPQTV